MPADHQGNPAVTRITGKTHVLFTLGDPIAQIIGTALLTEHLAARGVDAAVAPLHVAPEDLPATIDCLRRLKNVPGFGLTIPHKIAVMDLLDEISARARLVGAVNYVRRNPDGSLYGDNIDGLGFVGGLRKAGVAVDGKRVLQAGAGGAGRAIAFAMAEAGAIHLTVTNRTHDRAAELAAAVGAAYPGCSTQAGGDDPTGFDIVINTTSLGMKAGDGVAKAGNGLPIDVARMAPGCVAAEVVMTPEMTPFLAAAAARGCVIVLGKEMLLAQLEAARELVGL